MKFYGQFTPPVDQFIFERYFPETGIEGVFVECGAFDGLTECSCKFFEEIMNWKGYNFEPLPWVYEKLQHNRPHSTNLNYGLSNATGKATFHAVDHPHYGLDCTNGSLQHHESHKLALESLGCSFREIEVELTTWKKFINDYKISRVDLLVLDVEGHEMSVLEGMKDCLVLPDIICIEYGHLGLSIVRKYLESFGYAYDITSNANAFFVKNEKLSLFSLRNACVTIQSEKKEHIIIEENTYLKAQLSSMTHLYNEIIGSKSWKIIEIIKKIVGKRVGN